MLLEQTQDIGPRAGHKEGSVTTSPHGTGGDDADTDNLNDARDYAWSWFELHAGQRMQLINYLLISLAFVTAGYGAAINAGVPAVASVVALFGMVLCIAFLLFDVRTRALVKVAEKPLREIESILRDRSRISTLNLVEVADRPTYGVISFASILRVVVGSAVVACLAGATYGFVAQYNSRSLSDPCGQWASHHSAQSHPRCAPMEDPPRHRG